MIRHKYIPGQKKGLRLAIAPWHWRNDMMTNKPLKYINNFIFTHLTQVLSVILGAAFPLSLCLISPLLAQPVSPTHLTSPHHIFVSNKNKHIIPVAVFGKDQRQRLPKQYRYLDHQIGLLHNSKTNTLCTAFCVGPDIIATASHCLFSHRKNKRLHISNFLFKLKANKKKSSYYSRLAGHRINQSRRYIITGTSRLNRKPPIGAAKDWALIRLERPSCKNGWLKSVTLSHQELAKAARNKKLFQIAYHMDYRNWQIAYSRSCSVSRSYGGLTWRNIKRHFSSSKSLILHQCDTGEASSGSPLLLDSADGPRFIGINVGTYQQREITVRNGRVLRRTRYRTIANTAVSSKAFSRKIDLLKQAKVIIGKGALKTLQINLIARNYYRGAIDGIYGARTELAIKAFEKATSRPITGLATHDILLALSKINGTGVTIETSAGHQSSTAAPQHKLNRPQ